MGKKGIYVFLALILALHIFAFTYQLVNNNYFLADSFEYLQEAENIFSQGKFYCGNLNEQINPDLFTKRPPLYPLFIGFSQLFPGKIIPLLLFQNLLSLFNILIILKLAFRYFKLNKTLIFIFILFSPAQAIYANLVMSEILFQTLLIMMVLYFLSFIKSEKIKHFFLSALFLILAMLTKPVIFPFAFIMIALGLLYAFRKKMFGIFLISIIPFLIVNAYKYWNFERTGYYHFSSITNINLVNYNTNFFLSKTKGIEEANRKNAKIYEEASKLSDYGSQQEYLKNQAMEIIKNDLIKYSVFHLKGSFRFFIDPGRFDIYNFFGLEEDVESGFLYTLNEKGFKAAIKQLFSLNPWAIVLLLFILIFNILKTIGFSLFIFAKGVKPVYKISIMILPVYIALATGPLGASRFMLPVLLFIILGAVAFYGNKFSIFNKK
jgi:hypothetical protein